MTLAFSHRTFRPIDTEMQECVLQCNVLQPSNVQTVAWNEYNSEVCKIIDD